MPTPLTRVAVATAARIEAEDAANTARDTAYAYIVAALRAGHTVSEVATASQYSVATVRAIRRAHNIPPGKSGRRSTS